MRYDLSKDEEAQEAADFLGANTTRDRVIEMKVVRAQRTLNQNAYLHLLLQICANEWGYSLPEIKTIWKRDIAPSVFIYFKNDKPFIKSSADLDSKQMTDSIELLKKYAAENELDLPDADDKEKLRYYELQIQRNARFI